MAANDSAVNAKEIHTNKLYAYELPTSDPSVAGQIWSNSGVLTVSSG